MVEFNVVVVVVEKIFFEKAHRLIVDEIVSMHKYKYKMDTKQKKK